MFMTSSWTRSVAVAAVLLSLGANAGDPPAVLPTPAPKPAAAPPPAAPATPPTPVEKPTPEAVRTFWKFWFKGQQQGLVLADAKLCLEIGKEGDAKSECIKEVPAEGVKPGTLINVWQAYLLPQGDHVDDIVIQLKLGDQVRETKDVKAFGNTLRFRAWNALRIPKAGKWTINLMRGTETLKSWELSAQ
jgi:hypothetical protein